MSIPLLILVGPTASGKSELALSLAQVLDAEILSADSMAIYRGMDVGTAKPSPEERRLVPHHLIDICDPWEVYSTGSFVEEAQRIIADIHAREKAVIIVGGTALYIKHLLEGIFEGPAANLEIRKALAEKDAAALYEELKEKDPEAAQKIAAKDVRRIVRALEVYRSTGIPITEWQKKHTHKNVDYEPFFIGIHWERAILYARIEARVDKMLQKGLIEETQALLHLPYPLSRSASQAIGYKETIEALQNQFPIAELPEKIKINTRHFAKRQMTWWRRFPVHWMAASGEKQGKETEREALELWRKRI